MLTCRKDVVQWLFLTVPLNNNKNNLYNVMHENNFTYMTLWSKTTPKQNKKKFESDTNP